jgi:hypothetical protein
MRQRFVGRRPEGAALVMTVLTISANACRKSGLTRVAGYNSQSVE